MIALFEFAGRPVGVFGLGKAGESTVAALLAGGAQVYAWDDSEKSRQALASRHPAAHLLPFSEWPWGKLACIALSPGVPLTHPEPHPVVRLADKAACPVCGDIELLYRAHPQATYVGITGTNGKSTTTALVGHILKEAGVNVQIGGNIGTPALSLAPLNEGGVYVLELSSYQLDLLQTARFNVAALLNITPDHLDRHGDMQGYVAAKMHIFDRQKAGDTAVIAVEDEHTRSIALDLRKRAAEVIEVRAQQVLEGLDLAGIATLTGRHNWQNAAVAYAVARRCGVSQEKIFAGMRRFPGLAHRLELIAEIGGVRFINDSKATNAEATANALAPYENIYWILGGKPKEGGISPLETYFPKIAHAFLIGEAAEAFAVTLKGKAPYTHCGTLEVAAEKATALALAEKKPGAVVLLSPACASFDQFTNFEERGDRFRSLVENVTRQFSRAAHAS